MLSNAVDLPEWGGGAVSVATGGSSGWPSANPLAGQLDDLLHPTARQREGNLEQTLVPGAGGNHGSVRLGNYGGVNTRTARGGTG